MMLGVSAQKSHTVVKGDTPYNIAKKYGLTVDELYKLNPKVKDGKLALGDILTVKTEKAAAAAAPKTGVASKPVNNSQVGKIVLQPKQTIYGLTKQYRISETDLRKLNPELDSHMKIGDEITLPLESIKKYGGDQQQSIAAAPKPAETAVEIQTADHQATEGEYVVQSKDNYYRISRQFNITKEELFELNPGLEERGLKPGESILLPE